MALYTMSIQFMCFVYYKKDTVFFVVLSLLLFVIYVLLVNLFQKGARFNSTTMFSAREALIPGGVYDRSKMNVNAQQLGRMLDIYKCDTIFVGLHFGNRNFFLLLKPIIIRVKIS
jgi:hypothetical protein